MSTTTTSIPKVTVAPSQQTSPSTMTTWTSPTTTSGTGATTVPFLLFTPNPRVTATTSSWGSFSSVGIDFPSSFQSIKKLPEEIKIFVDATTSNSSPTIETVDNVFQSIINTQKIGTTASKNLIPESYIGELGKSYPYLQLDVQKGLINVANCFLIAPECLESLRGKNIITFKGLGTLINKLKLSKLFNIEF